MKLAGFGCSFTYGSELLDPELANSWDRHHENTPYRERHSWLGRLAEKLDASYINLAEPAGSNFSIQEKFAGYIQNNDCSNTIICVAWTNHLRNSWWSDKEQRWIHDGFIRNENETLFGASFKEWLTHSHKRCEQATLNAKLFVNSVCEAKGIKIIQFDALSNVNSPRYSNYHMQGRSMQDVLIAEGKRLGKEFLASGGHPNEAGHTHYVDLMMEWIKAKNIV